MLNKIGTHTRGVFVYDGESSDAFGMVVSEPPVFSKAKRRTTVYNVPGKNGAILAQEDAFDDVPVSYKLWTTREGADLATRVNNFTSWLYSKKGYLRLEDDFNLDVYRLAYVDGGKEFTNELMLWGETTATFICRPECYLKSGEQSIDISGGAVIYNPTRYASRPLIHIEGNGIVTLKIGAQTLTADVDGYINIDVDAMNAYKGENENRNNKVSGTFPQLFPEDNTITITGATSAYIIPRFYLI